jgi:putative DNA-binding protein
VSNQTEFKLALLSPALPVPDGLVNPDGRPASRRFDVYRNNVASSLTEALISGFPVLHSLVGEEFFRALAGVYLRRHPAASPMMMHYGQDMPAFLQRFPPVARFPYLPDIARIEIAMRHAYHARDPAVVAQTAYVRLGPGSRIDLAGTLIVVRSQWPVYDIWNKALAGTEPLHDGAQDIVVTRAEFDPVVQLLPAGAADVLTALRQGKPLGAALVTAGETFDLAPLLTLMIEARAITKISNKDDER